VSRVILFTLKIGLDNVVTECYTFNVTRKDSAAYHFSPRRAAALSCARVTLGGGSVIDGEVNQGGIMESKTKHTPGPFLSMGASYAGRAYRVQKGGEQYCGCYLWDDDSGPNGKGDGVQFFLCELHAAAPDLLRAAQAVLVAIEVREISDVIDNANPLTMDTLRAAIRKAQGEGR
jgi:hypothetical protein